MVYEVKFEGVQPYIMSSDKPVDLEDVQARELSNLQKAKKKTDAEQMRCQELQFLLACYTHPNDPKGFVQMPGENVEASLLEGARIRALGKKIERGVRVLVDFIDLHFDGAPLTPEQLWTKPEYRDRRVVKTKSGRVVRTLPVFRNWSVIFQVHVDPEMMTDEEFRKVVALAGKYAGLGSMRPRYGSYKATVTLLSQE